MAWPWGLRKSTAIVVEDERESSPLKRKQDVTVVVLLSE